MKRHEINSAYRQFYVADAELQPPAPEDWTDTHLQQRHNTLEHIAALCPEGAISARIICCGPGDVRPELRDQPDFEVCTSFEAPSGQVGVYEWPFELIEQYRIAPGRCEIRFTGFKTDMVDQEQDYYLVEIEGAEHQPAPYFKKSNTTI